MDLAREVVNMHLHLVETRRRHRQAHQPVDPNHAAAARREGQRVEQTARAHVVRFGALADLARPDVGDNIACLTRPEGEPADEGSRLVTTEMPAQRRVVAFLQDARLQLPPVGHAQAIRFALPPAVEQAAADDEGALVGWLFP